MTKSASESPQNVSEPVPGAGRTENRSQGQESAGMAIQRQGEPMNQRNEEQRERLAQIRDLETRRATTSPPSWSDIDFLLSLLDSLAVDPITYYNQDGSYNPVGKNIANHASTAMRDACVEKVKAETPDSWLDPLLTGPEAVVGKPPYDCKDVERLLQAVSKRIVTELESLTLDQVQEKR